MPAATTPDPWVGRTLGNVRLTARLGAGAMGVVYRGWHKHFGREVAVKILLAKSDDTAHYRERFLREGQAAAKVSNDHVVQVLEAGQHENIAYLVMELVNGTSLGTILNDTGLLAPAVVQRLGVGISLGIAAIHAKGILHRDIKPDNILVGADQKPKVADLGLAKQIDDPALQRLTATGIMVGTPLYLSPEAIRDPQSIDAKSDIYSLGATLYQMLVGKPPFTGATPFDVMRGHLDLKPTPIRLLRPEVPIALAETVAWCLAKNPRHRPTALELADVLAQGARPKRRLPWLAVCVGVCGVSVVGALAWLFVLPAPTSSPPSAVTVPTVTATQARLRVFANAAQIRIRIDDSEWLPGSAEGVLITPGPHRIVVEAVQDGPLLRGFGQGSLVAGQTADLHISLDLVSVPPARVEVPGVDGMIFVDGVAYGPDPAVTCSRAGRYHVARWVVNTWHSALVVVDDAGQVSDPAWAASDTPPATAYWVARSELGSPLPIHHVLCWWEVERSRSSHVLPAPVGWTTHSTRPEEPATTVTIAMVQACAEDAAKLGGRLPDRSQALALADELQTACWCQEQGNIDKVGGIGGSGAQLVMVPK